ncbi:MAG: hypothetical protein V3U54_02085 [Thermodesulfobacteriota bacterium]
MKHLIIMIFSLFFAAVIICSCAPAEPMATDTLKHRAEPSGDDEMLPPPEIQEEIESYENPLETEEMEQQPLIK